MLCGFVGDIVYMAGLLCLQASNSNNSAIYVPQVAKPICNFFGLVYIMPSTDKASHLPGEYQRLVPQYYILLAAVLYYNRAYS